ncbi:MAG: deoxyribose-phosphate aldolase [Acidimicrobiia bacterium]
MPAITIETLTPAAAAATFDHALLRPELDLAGVDAGCELAASRRTVAVCCRPADVARCAANLRGTGVLVTTVIGFPHGAHLSATKVFEAERAMEDGAVELDMVINIGHLRSGDDAFVEQDIAAVVKAAAGGASVKAILENAYLTDEEKVRACRLAESAGAAYVKTSTGYAPSAATLADVRLMRATVSPHVKVKAAGGVRTVDDLLAFLDAGCDRIGTSSTAALLDELHSRRAALGLAD